MAKTWSFKNRRKKCDESYMKNLMHERNFVFSFSTDKKLS